MIAIPLVTGCYVLVNIAYLTVLSSAEIAHSSAVAVVSMHNNDAIMDYFPFKVLYTLAVKSSSGLCFVGQIFRRLNLSSKSKKFVIFHRRTFHR